MTTSLAQWRCGVKFGDRMSIVAYSQYIAHCLAALACAAAQARYEVTAGKNVTVCGRESDYYHAA